MNEIIHLGAISIATNKYEIAILAESGRNKYKCPECLNEVIVRKGKINVAHFAHYNDGINKCPYYDAVNDDNIHSAAQQVLYNLLETHSITSIDKECNRCFKFENILIEYTDTMVIHIEYNFIYNNRQKIADIAVIDNNIIIYIFEIYYTHKTLENNRPEPWYEISAQKLLKNNDITNIKCVRHFICDKCELIEFKRIENYNIKKMKCLKLEQEQKRIAEEKRIQKEKEDEEQKRIEEEAKRKIQKAIVIYIKKIRIQKEKKRQRNIDAAKKKMEEMQEEANKKMEERQEKAIELYKLDSERRTREEQEEKKKQERLNAIELEKRRECGCGIRITYICVCKNPIYELVKPNQQLWCKRCDKWKCRC